MDALLKRYEGTLCHGCWQTFVQLWRPYGSFYREDDNRCQCCAEADQGKERRGDQIGWFVPLVLDADGRPWGFTSAPSADVILWCALDANVKPPPGMERLELSEPHAFEVGGSIVWHGRTGTVRGHSGRFLLVEWDEQLREVLPG